jgi:hypothetical protein
MNERMRRQWASAEARSLGWGSVVVSTRRVLIQLAGQWPFWDFYRRAVTQLAGMMPSGP